jgi:hypothetical protein
MVDNLLANILSIAGQRSHLLVYYILRIRFFIAMVGCSIDNYNNLKRIQSTVYVLRGALASSPKGVVNFTKFRKAIECYAARRLPNELRRKTWPNGRAP